MPAARITDMHACPMATGIVPHVGGPICTGFFTVITGSMPQARISDMCVCVGPPDVIVKGSATVIVGGMPAARIGDMTAHGGVIVTGFPTVIIGDASDGGGGGGGGGAGAGSMAQGAATAGQPGSSDEAEAGDVPAGLSSKMKQLYHKAQDSFGVPGGRLAVIADEVNPDKGTVNCGNIIDAVKARLLGTDPKAVAPVAQDGSFNDIEKRFGTKLNWKSSLDDAFKQVSDGGHGTMGIVALTRPDYSSHIIFIANHNGRTGIIEGQAGGKFIDSVESAKKFYDPKGGNTFAFGLLPEKFK